MLILTRRVGEGLIIGDNIEVRVLGIRGQQVRVGIVAPPEVKVVREEIAPGAGASARKDGEGSPPAEDS